MKHSSRNNQSNYLYLEPYTFTVIAGNDVLIYNSVNGKVLEFRDSSAIVNIIRETENSKNGFLAGIDHDSEQNGLSQLISALRESFSGNVVSSSKGITPSVIRPKAIIKNYPPRKDFPSFSADDYLRNIYFFLNQDNNDLCTDYRYAAEQVSCPVYHPLGYREMDFERVFRACLPYTGVSGIGIDLSGSDLTKYSDINEMTKLFRKLFLPFTFHLPLPCIDPDMIWKFLKTRNSRISLYITIPDGPSALREMRKNVEFSNNKKRIDLNFLIRSLEEYQIITEFIHDSLGEKTFIFPYYNGLNTDFFRENVFLTRNDILNLKPNQKQVYSRSLINEHLFGKIFIKTDGEAYASLNHESHGNIMQASISDLVRNELYNGLTWNLTRMKVKPCSACLYQLFCPPIGNYELFMKKFNFCDVL